MEKILAGISNIRNPILVYYVAKGLLPYHGLGSGIKRALDGWPEIAFADDRDGCLFTATVHRKVHESSEMNEPSTVIRDEPTYVSPNLTKKGSEKSSDKIAAILRENPKFSARRIVDKLGITPRTVEKQNACDLYHTVPP